MPPHNNRAEQEIHGGMRRMSVLSTVFRTAENLGVWPSTAVRMTARDPGWDMFAHADGPGPPLRAGAAPLGRFGRRRARRAGAA